MASIQKRENGRWRARYRDAAGKEHARHFRRKVDAQRWLDEVTTSVVTGTYVDPHSGRLTFGEWFREWSAVQVWARGTFEAASQAASGVPFAGKPVRDVRTSDVQAWIADMSARLAPSTVRTRYNYVRSAFRAAKVDRLIPVDPCDAVRWSRASRARDELVFMEHAEVAAALAVADDWFRPFVKVCAFAGLRLGEAAGLRVSDVDFLRRTIRVDRQVQGSSRATTIVVPPKHGSARTVHVPEALTDSLAAHVRDVGVWGGDRWLFGPGELLNRNSAGEQWRTTRRRAGLDRFTLHDLRHYYASGLIQAGCDVATVQKALGHSSPAITLNVYTHAWSTSEERTRSAAADLMRAVVEAPADSVRTEGENLA